MIESLEEKVDPFDLDVFSPYMQSHLMKQGQRSAVSEIKLLSWFSVKRDKTTVMDQC